MMQFVRYQTNGTHPTWGLLDGNEIHQLANLPTGEPSLDDLANPSYRQWVKTVTRRNTLPTISKENITFLTPIPRPGQLIAVGLNYRDHAAEQDADLPESPLLFTKASSSVTNPETPIVLPSSVEQVDHEVELGVIIGRTARNVAAQQARNYIAGYTVVNDVSARDAQFADKQNFRGKSYETFAPMGPILTIGDGFDPHDLRVELRVNGVTKQESSTNQLIFDVNDLIEFISGIMTLRPGDVIATGTPGGVGIFRDPPELLEPGDVVEAEVEGIGTLTNPVVAESES